MQACRLYAYRLPAGPFRPHEAGGYWVSGEQVNAIEQVLIDDLLSYATPLPTPSDSADNSPRSPDATHQVRAVVGGMRVWLVAKWTTPSVAEELVDIALAEALAPVLRDLESSGSVVVPDVRDDQWSDVEGQVTAMLHSPDGSAQGVSAMITEPLQQRIASVADQVQEWAVEELCSIGRPATWPECPQHPDSHPLSAVVREGRAAWSCPNTGDMVSEIGQLPTPRRQRKTPRRR